jgi:hypothetical protein
VRLSAAVRERFTERHVIALRAPVVEVVHHSPSLLVVVAAPKAWASLGVTLTLRGRAVARSQLPVSGPAVTRVRQRRPRLLMLGAGPRQREWPLTAWPVPLGFRHALSRAWANSGHGPPRGEQGRPDQLFRRGLRDSSHRTRSIAATTAGSSGSSPLNRLTRGVHPAAHPPRLSIAAAHHAPEPHGEAPSPIAARSRWSRCRAVFP